MCPSRCERGWIGVDCTDKGIATFMS
jgi:hypothetical protein